MLLPEWEAVVQVKTNMSFIKRDHLGGGRREKNTSKICQFL